MWFIENLTKKQTIGHTDKMAIPIYLFSDLFVIGNHCKVSVLNLSKIHVLLFCRDWMLHTLDGCILEL